MIRGQTCDGLYHFAFCLVHFHHNFTPDFQNPDFKQSEIPKSQIFLLESQNPELAYWALILGLRDTVNFLG